MITRPRTPPTMGPDIQAWLGWLEAEPELDPEDGAEVALPASVVDI